MATDTVIQQDVHEWARKFQAALASGDPSQVLDLIADGGMWRDILAFTWDIVSLEDISQIEAMLRDKPAKVKPRNFTVEAKAGASEGWLNFETEFGDCTGYVRLHDGLAFTLMTALQDLSGHRGKRGKYRELGVYDDGDARNWLERKQDYEAQLGKEEQPYVLIVGGGQGGLALGAQLRTQGVPFLIVDKYEKPGDQWRARYKSLTLHDPVWFDHMPIIPFPDNWPVYTPKDRVADFLESYAKILDITFWGNTAFTSAKRNAADDGWEATVEKDGKEIILKPAHIVMATGNSGFPNIPEFDGADIFEGEQMHSSEFTSGENYAGKDVVVIGANNSAHDICANLVENGIQPTMVQRSSTLILSAAANRKAAATMYSEEAVEAGLTTQKADLLGASMTIKMAEPHQRRNYERIAKDDADYYKRLTDAGFELDFGEDGTGLWIKYLRKGAGYYIDVGASQMIVDGRIKLRSGVGIDRLTKDSVILSDGSELKADIVVYATGFGSMEEWVKRLISPEIADKIGKCWGYGSGTRGDPGPWEGELRNMWKPTAQDGLWFHGGNLQQSRFYSHYLALQLKARFVGMDVDTF